jgi:2-(1,2-epoxy-1,2-dihydrophenyl)acetyl-CoA isomerase
MLERGPSAEETPEVGDLLRERYHPIIKGIRELPKPVVAAVNGPAVGIGCSLALACDLIWAAESAIFGLAFVNIGLVPDGGSTFLVPVAAGKARALEMALLGDPIPASKALEWGLVNRVVPDGELLSEARSLAKRLASGPTRSYANSKRALNNSLMKIMDEQLDLEADIQGEMTGTADFIEGVSAFVEKREPRFTGT